MSVLRELLKRRRLSWPWLNVAVLTSLCGTNASMTANSFSFQHIIKPIGWDAYQVLLRQSQFQEHQYPITHPHLVVDTIRPLQQCLTSILTWLDHLKQLSSEEARGETKPPDM